MLERINLVLVGEQPVEPGPKLAFGNLPRRRTRDPVVCPSKLHNFQKSPFQAVTRGDFLGLLWDIEELIAGIEQALESLFDRGGRACCTVRVVLWCAHSSSPATAAY